MKWLFFLLPLCLLASEEEIVSRFQALSVIGDCQLSTQEAHAALKRYPASLPIHLLAVKMFADAGEEEQMMASFRQYQRLLPDDLWPRNTLEEMAWGVIEKGGKGGSPLIRAIALIAAAMGNDARGIAILEKNCVDSHRQVRALAVEFMAHFRDEALQEIVKERFLVEKDAKVRLALLQAIGPMRIQELEGNLLAVLDNERSLAEEKTAAIASLFALKETVEVPEIQKLIQNPRGEVRALGARLIQIRNESTDAALLLPLLQDSHGALRKEALEALGSLRVKEIQGRPILEWITPLLVDSIPEVAMTSAWVLMLDQPVLGQEKIKPWLNSPHSTERLFAALVLKGAGKYGYPLTLQAFNETNDWMVKLNLAVGLLEQNQEKPLASQVIYETIINHPERLMPCDFGRFQGIGPCMSSHRPDIPHYPELINQVTRLELLNILAIHKHPGALGAVRQFLQERSWGITGAASALLLTEGEEEALSLIRTLLSDPSDKVRLQAALVLAMWGNDPEAISTLQQLYPRVSQNKKEQIIEALGKIGDFSTIPFLVERLEEPHQTLRMIGAAAILETLYH